MKKYSVIILPEAEQDILDYGFQIAKDSIGRAVEWEEGALSLCYSLSEFAKRFPRRFVDSYPDREIRGTTYFSHLIIYEVVDETDSIRVLAVRPASYRKPDEGIGD